jgi:tetratricopeptide (TPR) repeat protein
MLQSKYDNNLIIDHLIECVNREKRNELLEHHIENDMEFSAKLSEYWILELIKSSKHQQVVEYKINQVLEIQNYFEQLETNRISESDIRIYAYFLYFSGVLFIIKSQPKKLDSLVTFFNDQYMKDIDSHLKLFLKFLIVYIKIINPKKDNIEVFNDLKDCLVLNNVNDDVIFDAIKREKDLMIKTIEKNYNYIKYDMEEKVRNVFPKISKNASDQKKIDIVNSLLSSGLARLYFVAGQRKEYQKELDDACKKFDSNSFALVQKAFSYVDKKKDENNDKTDNKINLNKYIRNIEEAVKIFNNVNKLIEKDNQFKNIDSFNYRIKLESIMGLAYIDYLKGFGNKADENYKTAINIVEKDLKTTENNKSYLKMIILVNKARNKLDNFTFEYDQNARYDLLEALKIYDNSNNNLKDELTDIAVRAYNNLGLYYIKEGLDEEAEKTLKEGLVLNTNPHVRYNLGVFYYNKGEFDRALTLIRNAQIMDPEFKEANESLQKLNVGRKNLGTEWFEWWFENKNAKKRDINESNILRNSKTAIIKKIVIISLISIMSLSIAKLAFDLYLHDIANVIHTNIIMQNPITGAINPHQHDINANSYLVLFGICISISMLPFINRINIGDVQIEVESAGSRIIGPASMSTGFSVMQMNSCENNLVPEFILAPFWIYTSKEKDNDSKNINS